ncbi:MAG TPA: cupin domain-containing protein [Pirellulaceae bacterium]|nr:cupin domain-containing protein [Pirellulaceae bacterium]
MTTFLAPASQLLQLGQPGITPEVPLKSVLLSTPTLQIVQLHLSAGKEIPPHSAPGEITVQLMRGRVSFHVDGQTHDLIPGTLLYVAAGQEHSLQAVEDSRLLVTKRLR